MVDVFNCNHTSCSTLHNFAIPSAIQDILLISEIGSAISRRDLARTVQCTETHCERNREVDQKTCGEEQRTKSTGWKWKEVKALAQNRVRWRLFLGQKAKSIKKSTEVVNGTFMCLAEMLTMKFSRTGVGGKQRKKLAVFSLLNWRQLFSTCFANLFYSTAIIDRWTDGLFLRTFLKIGYLLQRFFSYVLSIHNLRTCWPRRVIRTAVNNDWYFVANLRKFIFLNYQFWWFNMFSVPGEHRGRFPIFSIVDPLTYLSF